MRVRVADANARLRWATLPDDLAGTLAHSRPLRSVVIDRCRLVLAVAEATHGESALQHLSKTFGLTRAVLDEILTAGEPTRRQSLQLELAFQNAVASLKLAAQ